MGFEVLANLNWRWVLIALVVLLALYVVVAFLRIRRLKQRGKSVTNAVEPFVAQTAVAAYKAVQQPDSSDVPVALATEPEPLAAPSQAAFPWNEPPPEIPGQRQIEDLEREVLQLRKEVGGLRAEVLVLREEQRRETKQAQVTQNVSPLYSDAMQMAMQGHDAATVSQHCGISRAEAELVVSLVRNRDLQ